MRTWIICASSDAFEAAVALVLTHSTSDSLPLEASCSCGAVGGSSRSCSPVLLTAAAAAAAAAAARAARFLAACRILGNLVPDVPERLQYLSKLHWRRYLTFLGRLLLLLTLM
jgi:hypothetical protein